jgi:uncharacterized Zn-binding protein involved in type VI secretion
MPGIARVGQDTAGGTITGSLAPTVIVNGFPIAVKGAAVAPHGDAPHNSAVMVGSSGDVIANGIQICRAGDAASCGDSATGSSDVIAD